MAVLGLEPVAIRVVAGLCISWCFVGEVRPPGVCHGVRCGIRLVGAAALEPSLVVVSVGAHHLHVVRPSSVVSDIMAHFPLGVLPRYVLGVRDVLRDA